MRRSARQRDNKKDMKNAPSALLSYISTQEFLRTLEKCEEALAFGLCFSSVLKNSQVLITQQCSRNKFYFYFFYKMYRELRALVSMT